MGAIVAWAADDFRARGIDNPRLDAEVIVAFALGLTRMQLILDRERVLVGAELDTLRALVKRRRAREPVAYLRGFREFFGREFRVDSSVLVPRPDTEALVEVALERTRSCSMYGRVIDLCTGSGCVAITIARERPTMQVTATDVSARALLVAQENALRLGACGIGFREGDLFAGAPGPYELVTANPPYIPSGDIPGLDADVRDFEPRIALDGGNDGLAILRRVVEDAPDHLVGGGVLAVEIGADQGHAVRAMFEASGFARVEIRRDHGGHDRVVSGVYG